MDVRQKTSFERSDEIAWTVIVVFDVAKRASPHGYGKGQHRFHPFHFAVLSLRAHASLMSSPYRWILRLLEGTKKIYQHLV